MAIGNNDKDKCKCVGCAYCKKYKTNGFGSRYEVHCKTDNQDFINNYFSKHKIQKMPGFIGFENRGVFPIKRTPKWCPLNNLNDDGI